MVKQAHVINPHCDVSAWLWLARRKLYHFDRDALNLIDHYKLSIFHESMAMLTKRHSKCITLVTGHYRHVVIDLSLK